LWLQAKTVVSPLVLGGAETHRRLL